MTSLSSNQSNQSFLHNHPFPSVCLDFPLIFLLFHTCVESPLNFFQVPYLPRNLPPPFPPGLDRPRRAERKRIERESARFEETQRWAGRHAPFSPVAWTEPHCAETSYTRRDLRTSFAFSQILHSRVHFNSITLTKREKSPHTPNRSKSFMYKEIPH